MIKLAVSQNQIITELHQELSHLLIVAAAAAAISRITYFSYKFILNLSLNQILVVDHFMSLFLILSIILVFVNFLQQMLVVAFYPPLLLTLYLIHFYLFIIHHHYHHHLV